MEQNGSVDIKSSADIPGAGETRFVALPSLPTDPRAMQDMSGFSFLDPFAIAAFTVAALCEYELDRDSSIAMINTLKGSERLSQHDEEFLRDRFAGGKGYIPRSYLRGATPDNGYTPDSPITVTVTELPDSRREAGYIDLYLTSGGADSPRPVRLRQKPSTGEWFLWSFAPILSGIRVPKAIGSRRQ